MHFRYSRGGIYNDNKDLIKRVTEAQNYEKQKEKAQSSPSDLASDAQNASGNEVHDPNAVASEPDFSDVSPELMQAMIGKSNVKQTLHGDALFNAFEANDAKAFEAEKKNLLSAYYALQLYGIQCNDVTELMVSIAYGSHSDENKFFANGFKGALFKPETGANPSLEDRYLSADYEANKQTNNLESRLKKISEGQKRTEYLEKFRSRLHGKGDPAWNDAKEGDFIMQFQGADLKIEKKGKLDQDNSYAEDQFRHVAVIVKIIHAQDLKKSEFKSAIIAGKNVANPLSNKEKSKLSSEERARVEAEEKFVKDSYNEYVERAYRENHRIATTMGAGSQGVGINDKGWKAISPHSLDYNENRNLLWHDMDEDWYRNGIIRTGNAADTSRIQKVYLFK